MKIRVEEVRKKRVELAEEQPAAHFPSLEQLEQQGECRFVEPVKAEVSAVWEYDHVRATGSVTTAAELSCSRCLADYRIPISSGFTIFYTKSAGAGLDEEVELSEEDLISVGYEGDEIDNCHWCLDGDECSTLRLLAMIYASHPDFREEWRI